MIAIHIHPPDGAGAARIELAEGEVLLVGREPEAAAADPQPSPTRRLAVASPLVSSRHLLVWRDGDELHARDLHSKNGSYLRLERGAHVESRGASEAHLFLAAPRQASRAVAPGAVGVADGGPDEFAERMKESVAAWLRQAGLLPRLRVLRAESEAPALDDPSRFSLPLVDGRRLEISDQDSGGTQASWDEVKAELFPFAYDQCAAFLSCRAARLSGPLAFRSPLAERTLRDVLEAARSRLPLVLTGESGTGKTALAAIYAGRESLRAGRSAAVGDGGGPPFVTVHCAHLDAPLAHSQLFGAQKGSYTSSERTVLGAVKLADGGTLFLDDVDALSLETQGKLLRFLDHGEYEPLGHGQREPLRAEVRVVAGTNANLRAAVREGRFREDLYWRLHSGAVVRVPPLRERPEDIEQLLRESPGTPSLDEAENGGSTRAARPARSVLDRLEPGALELLLSRHPWRGNFRECLRFCARVRMEPSSRALLDRRRCEEILAEATLDEEAQAPAVAARGAEGGGVFERALREAVAWWTAQEGSAPARFDDLQRFCENYLKSSFVAHALGLGDAEERPDAFDRDGRQRLGCDLSTVKRKVDDYVALKRSIAAADSGERR